MFIGYFKFILNNMIIQQYKTEYKKWIIKNNNMLMFIFTNLIKWIDRNLDLDRFWESQQSYINFCIFIYAKYLQPINKYPYNFEKDDLYYHYETKYYDDIMDIFSNFKEVSRSQNSRLFHQKRDVHIDLLDFIYSICDYNDPYIDDEVKEEDIHYHELIEND